MVGEVKVPLLVQLKFISFQLFFLTIIRLRLIQKLLEDTAFLLSDIAQQYIGHAQKHKEQLKKKNEATIGYKSLNLTYFINNTLPMTSVNKAMYFNNESTMGVCQFLTHLEFIYFLSS